MLDIPPPVIMMDNIQTFCQGNNLSTELDDMLDDIITMFMLAARRFYQHQLDRTSF